MGRSDPLACTDRTGWYNCHRPRTGIAGHTPASRVTNLPEQHTQVACVVISAEATSYTFRFQEKDPFVTTLSEITALLGEPRFNWSDPAPWDGLERELGVELPADFREITDAYGSIEINKQLYLEHPAGHLLHSLGRSVRDDLAFWREEDMAEFLPSPVGADQGELIPVASATTGEAVFLRVPDSPSALWRVVVQEFDSPAWTLYEMTFGEWLLAYLKGRDVTLCSRNLAPDGPFYTFLP
ncbi:SMI1/KNR4 family protein [Streptomyces sp. NPDC058195]|uniref:SMI1/KNR4 family protein n=1 Tax=Streptomyces sp. NPDC058195 TaxID=3346375 RepID=UPI0036ED32C6